jgi:hypothetical protein
VIIGGWVAGRDGWKLGRRSAAREVAAQRDAGRYARARDRVNDQRLGDPGQRR